MLKIISNNTNGEILPNNLENKILEAGLTKRDVAAQKGVTPETLSRHMHGKIQLTLADAEQYASILGCTAQSILFAAEPVPVRAGVDVAKDGTTERIVYPDPVGYLHMHDVFPEPVFLPSSFFRTPPSLLSSFPPNTSFSFLSFALSALSLSFSFLI